jgi:hypothetical protein
VLVNNTSFNETPRPNPDGLGGPITPDGYAADLDFGGTEIVFDQCEMRDNAAGVVELLNFTAPTATTTPATYPVHMWTRNTFADNGTNNANRGNNAVAYSTPNPVQGMSFWWSNTATFTAPGTNVWFQQGQTFGDIPGTGAGAPWIARDNTGIPNSP